MPEPGMGPLIDCRHVRGSEACGEVAFRVTERPRFGDVVRLSTVRLLDGFEPSAATPMRCGSCGRDIAPAMIDPAGGYA